MVNHDYPVVVHPLTEEDGGGFIAFAPDLPGCMGDGETAAEAVIDLNKAIDEWIDEANRLHRNVAAPGECIVKEKGRNEKIRSLLKAQEDFIKEQDQRLKDQDSHLKQAREEIERIKASIMEAPKYHGRGELYAWVTEAMTPLHIREVRIRRRHSKEVH